MKHQRRNPLRRPSRAAVFDLRVRKLRAAGDHEGALAASRAALVHGAGSESAAWFRHATLLTELGRGERALESAQMALACDPAHLGALDLVLDSLDESDGELARIDAQLAARLAASPEKGGYDFGSLAVSYGLRRTRDVLSQSNDPDVQFLVTAMWPPPAQVASSEALLRLAIALAPGPELAALLADRDELPENVVPALRREARRRLRSQDLIGAEALLSAYTRERPTDTWARDRLMDARALPKDWQISARSRRLLTDGFPLPARATRRGVDTGRRALYLLHNSLPWSSAGYATRTHGLLTGLTAHGWSVTGLTRPGYPADTPTARGDASRGDEAMVDGITYRLLQRDDVGPKHPLEAYIERYARLLEQEVSRTRPSVLHAASNHWNGLAAAVVGRRTGIPVVYEARGLWELTRVSREPDWARSETYAFMAQMEAEAALGADQVFAITAAVREILVSRGVPREKIALLPNGVDPRRHAPAPRDAALADAIGLAGRTAVGYVGSLLEYEGLEDLLRAVALIARDRSDMVLVVVGDGPELDRLCTLVEELEISPHVIFTGRVPHDEVRRYYALLDLVVLPRKGVPVCEAVSPLKPFEAMAAGVPVIATDVAALAEIIDPEVTGLLAAKDDPSALAVQISRLLDDPRLRRDLADNARRWVRAERDWNSLARIVSDAWEALLDP